MQFVRELKSKSTIVFGIIVSILVVLSVISVAWISLLEPERSKMNNSQTKNGILNETDNEAYASSGALRFGGGEFELLGKPFRIVSGAVHYFRTVPAEWRDRLIKLKACGMNTIETELTQHHLGSYLFKHDPNHLSSVVRVFTSGTWCNFKDDVFDKKYVPWNLHEEYPGSFNYDGILDIRQFIKTAHDQGLYVIIRPGPYICSEWDFGGLPAWLLKDPQMKVRTTYPPYQKAVERFFDSLLPLLTDLQYSNGGPIIAFQIENEYGSFSSNTEHLEFIRQLFLRHGLKELFITSDNLSGINKDIFYKYALPTANFKEFKEGQQIFEQIHNFSKEFPLMVTEFWTGWFDHWTSEHSGLDVDGYLTDILKANASINFYMFHGGTNFGFMNGANKFEGSVYKPDVTSYDYDALLNEAGDITPKYMKTRELLLEYIYKPQGMTLPEVPGNSIKTSYGNHTVESFVNFESLIKTSPVSRETEPVPMEMLMLREGYGQNYGYILYRAHISNDKAKLRFSSAPEDRAQIFVDGKQVGLIDWKSNETALSLTILPTGTDQGQLIQLDILVENHGRVNYGTQESGIFDNQRKGITGSLFLNETKLDKMDIYPLEFKPDSANRSDWVSTKDANISVPALFQTTLTINGSPTDTFIYMKGWGKGIVLVNGFNLGRYWSAGPQQTLYVPGSILKQGRNQIVLFEHEKLGDSVIFLDKPILDVNDVSLIPV